MSENKDKDNKSFKTKKSVEELMSTASEKVDDKVKPSEIKDTSSDTKKVIGIGVGVFLLVLILGIIFIPKGQLFEDKTKTPDWVVEQEGGGSEKDLLDFKLPVEVPKWAKQAYTNYDVVNDEEFQLELVKWARGQGGLQNGLSWVPEGYYTNEEGVLKKSDYTSNPEYMFNEEGEDVEPNSNYYYTIKEDYERTYALAINRFVNPVFGGWFATQHIEGVQVKTMTSFNQFEDLFADGWWAENISEADYSALPIVADWEGDKFGGADIADIDDRIGVGYFYGEIIEDEEHFINTENLGEGFEGGIVLEVNTPVRFVSYNSEGKTIERYGNIQMVLAPNEYEFDSLYRVIVQSAKITIE